MDTIRQRKLQLFGHICRMSDDRLLKSLVFGMVEGERRPGRPVRRWIDDILIWWGKDVQEAMMMTVDRDNWRRFVASPYGPCWPRKWRRRRRNPKSNTNSGRPWLFYIACQSSVHSFLRNWGSLGHSEKRAGKICWINDSSTRCSILFKVGTSVHNNGSAELSSRLKPNTTIGMGGFKWQCSANCHIFWLNRRLRYGCCTGTAQQRVAVVQFVATQARDSCSGHHFNHDDDADDDGEGCY